MTDQTDWAKVLGELSADLTLSCNKQIAVSVAEAVRGATVPPELAVEVAAAVRMLHEAPPVVARNDVVPVPPLPRVTRIERDDDGNLVPVYEPLP